MISEKIYAEEYYTHLPAGNQVTILTYIADNLDCKSNVSNIVRVRPKSFNLEEF